MFAGLFFARLDCGLWYGHLCVFCVVSFYKHYSVRYYKGRSINKLQNGAIPLILKIGKIRNIRFVGNLILKIHKKF